MRQFFKERAFVRIAGGGALATVLTAAASVYISGVNGCTGQVSCVGTFMEVMQPAIKVLEISMAVLILWTISFRSKQTDAQITELKRTNNFKDYVAHKALVFEIFDSFESGDGYSLSNRHELYSKMYPNNRADSFDPTISSEFIKQAADLLEVAIREFDGLRKKDRARKRPGQRSLEDILMDDRTEYEALGLMGACRKIMKFLHMDGGHLFWVEIDRPDENMEIVAERFQALRDPDEALDRIHSFIISVTNLSGGAGRMLGYWARRKLQSYSVKDSDAYRWLWSRRVEEDSNLPMND